MNTRMFRILWGSQTLSNLADTLYLIAVVLLVLQMTDSTLVAALVPLCRVAGQLACGVWAPVLMDRYRLTRIMGYSQLAQALIFAAMVFTASVLSEAYIGWMLFLVVLMSFADGATTPSCNALVPRYVPREELLRANGLLSTSDQIVMMMGWVLGGIIVAQIGSANTMAGTLVMYILALVFTLQLKEPASEVTLSELANLPEPLYAIGPADVTELANATERPNATGPANATQPPDVTELANATESPEALKASSRPGAWNSMKAGWQDIWRSRPLRAMVIMDTIEGLVSGAWIGAMMLVYVTDRLQKSEEWWGFLNAAYFIGAIGGALLIVGLTAKLSAKPALGVAVGSLLFAMMTGWFALTTVPLLAVVLTVLMGPAQQMRDITRRTLFQKACPPERLPKVLSAQNTLSYSLFGVSVVLLGYLSDRYGIQYVYLLTALFYFITALLAVFYRKSLNIT
ncbi:hypothetical protein SY83_04145 [Paenibacillus swuensis]|uniref:MFS transporter n=1 Tax=Paenibacillus swuensis TaxID=1178515 RepID=A0A172TFE0_9BACL|nr:MFS transporter [Paenibacillus swuensis]ANE45624.1 hypothetical protein SY83_04145 [Paenibacillus swuensis]